MQRVLRSEIREVRAEVRGRRDMTEKKAEKENHGRGGSPGTREQKGVLARSVDFSACRERLGVNVKPDWSGNVTVLLRRQEVGSL